LEALYFKKSGTDRLWIFKEYLQTYLKMLLLAIWKYQWKIQLQIWLRGLKIFDSDTKIVDALLASSASFLVLFPYEINNEPFSDGVDFKCLIFNQIYTSSAL
jgi:NTE family protein